MTFAHILPHTFGLFPFSLLHVTERGFGSEYLNTGVAVGAAKLQNWGNNRAF